MSAVTRGMHFNTVTKRIVSALLIFSLAFPLGCARSSGAPDTYEELLFDADDAYNMFRQVASLRAQSIRLQLNCRG